MTRRLLVLAPRFPYPVVGGDRLRLHAVATTLSAHLELTLVSLCESTAELEMAVPDDGVFAEVHRVLLPPWRSKLHTALALPTRTPLQVAYYRDARFRRLAAELAPSHDGVFAHLIRTAAVALTLPRPRFLEMTDAISLNYERVRAGGGRHRDPRVAIYSVEQRRLLAAERALPDGFDASFLVSEVDRRHLFGPDPAARPDVLVCPNGVDLDRFPYRVPEPQDPPVLAFIGNMCSLQNLDAAARAARDLLPLVRRSHPQARLRLIGRIPPDKARELRAVPGVEVTGEVPDVVAAAHGAAVAVAPLRLGAGVQNKVLEYLALGLPTVTTPVALEGLAAVPGRDLLVADGDADFAAAVCRLLDSPEVRLDLAKAGRSYVERHHAWAAALAPMVERILGTLDRTGRARSGGRK